MEPTTIQLSGTARPVKALLGQRTVYVVRYSAYGDDFTKGVFSSEESARRFIAASLDPIRHDIEEFVIDERIA